MLSFQEYVSDAEAVAAIHAGQTSFFEIIVRRHNQRLFRISRSILADDDRALDALQEAYVKAFRLLDQLDDPARIGTWLNRIVRNEALMSRRKRWREAPVELDTQVVTAEDTWMSARAVRADERIVREELRAMLELAIDCLDDGFRAVFVLRAVEGMSVREVGEALDLPDGTVKSRYARARAVLRKEIESRLEGPLASVFEFDGARCDAIVATVMSRIVH